jgi:hypothetical protein
VAPIELFPFRFRDPRTGKWVRARYIAPLAELASRYREFEIIGPAEVRGDAGVQMSQPVSPPKAEKPLELQPHSSRQHLALATRLNRRLRRRFFPRSCLLLVAAVLSGCFFNRTTRENAVASDTCPIIAGRYLNIGAPVSEGFSANMGQFCDLRTRRPGWTCDFGLAVNLFDEPQPAFLSARSIEIQQPDTNTLSISIPDDPSIQPRTLSRSHGDFECDTSGLTMSKSGSVFNPVSTAIGVIALTGGVASSIRSFRLWNDGSLIMDVTNQSFFFHVFVAGTYDKRGVVRWQKDTGDSARGQATPKHD